MKRLRTTSTTLLFFLLLTGISFITVSCNQSGNTINQTAVKDSVKGQPGNASPNAAATASGAAASSIGTGTNPTGQTVPQPGSKNESTDKSDKVLTDYAKKSIEKLPPEPKSMADPNQLQQVFLNLLANARQATEAKKGARIVVRAAREGEKLVLTFRDNGVGIPPENLDKIFAPFFTTKPVGKGTGLGLSISYGIVQQHKGSIRAESEVGQGTAFIIEFPVIPSSEEGS